MAAACGAGNTPMALWQTDLLSNQYRAQELHLAWQQQRQWRLQFQSRTTLNSSWIDEVIPSQPLLPMTQAVWMEAEPDKSDKDRDLFGDRALFDPRVHEVPIVPDLSLPDVSVPLPEQKDDDDRKWSDVDDDEKPSLAVREKGATVSLDTES
ncbi:MAG: hypothetical protein M1826_005710 [Phylliscum demangeonii]|nr:MAG: hypothetical protein M1826_005710 [Phylliscum demangeonii]